MTSEEIRGKLDIINTILHKYRHHVCICHYGEHFSVWGCLPNNEGYLLDKSLHLWEFSTYQSFREWYYRFLRDQRKNDKKRKRIDKQNKRIALHNRVKDALKAKGMCIISYFDGRNLVHCIYEYTTEQLNELPRKHPVKSLSGDTELATWFNEWLERHR